MRYIRPVLKIWGWICLAAALVYLLLPLYGDAMHIYLNVDLTVLGTWIEMGLISMGLARVIELLEKK